VNLSLSEDQRLIRDSVRGFLAENAGAEQLRAAVERGAAYDETLWRGLTDDLGLAGLMAPEALGGAGLGVQDMALVVEALGERLAPVPFLESAVLALQAVLAIATPQQSARLAPLIASGAHRACLAFADDQGRPQPSHVEAVLTPTDAGWRLDGRARFISGLPASDLALVLARDEAGGLSLLALPLPTVGVTAIATESLDPTRPMGELAFEAVAVTADHLLGAPGQALAPLVQVLTIARALLAAEAVGGAQACLDMTLAYATERKQFGRAIGSFQAVKHALADMVADIEAARSAALYAALAVDQGGPDAEAAAAASLAWCLDAYKRCAGQAIQLHGGVGFTWEHLPHLYFKRAWSSAALLGQPDRLRESVAVLTGLDAPLPAPLQALGPETRP
jgi:alkylation response protein AidB-like acyl-CoA dehydrogenase